MEYLMRRLGPWESSYLADLKLGPPGEHMNGTLEISLSFFFLSPLHLYPL